MCQPEGFIGARASFAIDDNKAVSLKKLSTVPQNGYFTVSNHFTKSCRLSSNAYIYLELISSARMSCDKWQILTFKPYLVKILDKTKKRKCLATKQDT